MFLEDTIPWLELLGVGGESEPAKVEVLRLGALRLGHRSGKRLCDCRQTEGVERFNMPHQ